MVELASLAYHLTYLHSLPTLRSKLANHLSRFCEERSSVSCHLTFEGNLQLRKFRHRLFLLGPMQLPALLQEVLTLNVSTS